MKKGLAFLFVLMVLASCAVSPANRTMTLTQLDEENWPLNITFELVNYRQGVMTVLMNGETFVLKDDDPQSFVYVAQDLRSGSWSKTPLFSKTFSDTAKGKQYRAFFDVDASADYQVYLVLVPVEMAPGVNNENMPQWDGQKQTLLIWSYPVSRMILIQSLDTGEVVFGFGVTVYDGSYRQVKVGSSVVEGIVNVEVDPLTGYSLHITQTPVDREKLKKALMMAKGIWPDSPNLHNPADACWMMYLYRASELVDNQLAEDLCGQYYVPGK